MRVITHVVTRPYYQALNTCRVTKNNIRYVCSNLTLENAKELIRVVFLSIGKIFKGLGTVAGTPFFAMEFLINKCAGYPAKYNIGSEKYAFSENELQNALHRLTKPIRKVEKLELICPANSELHFNQASIQILQEILPDQLISRSFQIPQYLLNALETRTHYYRYNENTRIHVLSRKIFHLVLPANRNEALRSIDALVERGERVVNVYFFPSTRSVDELRDAMIPLAPQVALQVAFPSRSNIDSLMPLITLSESAANYF